MTVLRIRGGAHGGGRMMSMMMMIMMLMIVVIIMKTMLLIGCRRRRHMPQRNTRFGVITVIRIDETIFGHDIGLGTFPILIDDFGTHWYEPCRCDDKGLLRRYVCKGHIRALSMMIQLIQYGYHHMTTIG
jgi:hypothetical protein